MDLNRGTIAALLVAASAAGAGATWVATRTDTGDDRLAARLEAAAPTATGDPAHSSVPPAAVPAPAAAQPRATAPVQAATRASLAPTPAAPSIAPTAAPAAAAEAPVAGTATAHAAATAASQGTDLDSSVDSSLDNNAAVETGVIAAEPAQREPDFEELLVPSGMVLGLQIDAPISSEDARVEQRVEGRITRDVRVGDRVAIPAGSRILGEVSAVERGGRLRDRARLEIRFTSVELADGTRLDIDTAPIVREGDGPGRESTAKIGGSAIGGAIIGGILGGARGAVLGGSAGAAAGTGIVLAGGRNAAVVPAGTPLTVRLTAPASVVLDR